MENLDCFLSHNWGNDEDGRDNHQRVGVINRELRIRGFKTFFDEDDMDGSIVDKMCSCIDQSSIVLIFLTKKYMQKVESDNSRDNCKREFSYTDLRKSPDLMLPIVMETCMLSTKSWSGPVGMLLGGRLYVDFSSDSNFESRMDQLDRMIRKLLSTTSNSLSLATPISTMSYPGAQPIAFTFLITAQSGAIIRERKELNSSSPLSPENTKVRTAVRGERLDILERCILDDGTVRLRTQEGWLSERSKDNQEIGRVLSVGEGKEEEEKILSTMISFQTSPSSIKSVSSSSLPPPLLTSSSSSSPPIVQVTAAPLPPSRSPPPPRGHPHPPPRVPSSSCSAKYTR